LETPLHAPLEAERARARQMDDVLRLVKSQLEAPVVLPDYYDAPPFHFHAQAEWRASFAG